MSRLLHRCPIRSHSRSAGSMVLGLCAALLFSGCGGEEEPRRSDADEARTQKISPDANSGPSAPQGSASTVVGAATPKDPRAGATYQPVGDVNRGRALARSKCSMCHQVDGKGGKLAPAMDHRYKGKLLELMAGYPAHIERLKNISPQRYEQNQEQIEAILNAEDPTEKLSLWFKYYTKKPTFDREKSAMQIAFPNLSDQELDDIVTFVLGLE